MTWLGDVRRFIRDYFALPEDKQNDLVTGQPFIGGSFFVACGASALVTGLQEWLGEPDSFTAPGPLANWGLYTILVWTTIIMSAVVVTAVSQLHYSMGYSWRRIVGAVLVTTASSVSGVLLLIGELAPLAVDAILSGSL